MRFIFAFTVLFLAACGGKQETASSVSWEGTKDHYLSGTSTSIKLPDSFKSSSKYRIREDLPGLKKSGATLFVIQDALEKFESEDERIDVFIDTSSNYRFVTILDAPDKISIDKGSAAKLGKILMEDYGKMALSRKNIAVNKLESKIKNNNQQKLAKFKFEIKDKRKGTKTYATSFFITTSTRTLVIHEFSDSEEDLEFYTWSLNEGF